MIYSRKIIYLGGFACVVTLLDLVQVFHPNYIVYFIIQGIKKVQDVFNASIRMMDFALTRAL